MLSVLNSLDTLLCFSGQSVTCHCGPDAFHPHSCVFMGRSAILFSGKPIQMFPVLKINDFVVFLGIHG